MVKLLIIDDLLNNRILLKSLLKNEGYIDVEMVESAQDAFQLLFKPDYAKEGESVVDLILMDIMMPGMDGIEACRRMKESPLTRNIPVIMVTAKSGMQDLEEAFNAGAMDFITKPLRRLELMARIRSALNAKRQMDLLRHNEIQLRQRVNQLEMECQQQGSKLPEIADALEAANVPAASVIAAAPVISEDPAVSAHPPIDESQEILQRLIGFGILTGIEETSRFGSVVSFEWKMAIKNKIPMAVIVVEIDDYDRYIETKGIDYANNLTNCLGKVMFVAITGEGQLVFPSGHGRMTLIFTGGADADALKTAEYVQSRFKDFCLDQSVDNEITVSIGVATVQPHDQSLPIDLLDLGDDALRMAKEKGGNRIHLADSHGR